MKMPSESPSQNGDTNVALDPLNLGQPQSNFFILPDPPGDSFLLSLLSQADLSRLDEPHNVQLTTDQRS